MFKNLKSLFIVEDGTPTKPKPSPAKKKSAKSTKKEGKPVDKAGDSTAEKHIPPPPPRTDGSGQVTEKFTTMLLKAIEANNIDGFDYIEFKEAIQGTEGMGMSEEMRYKSAFAVAKTMGVTSVGERRKKIHTNRRTPNSSARRSTQRHVDQIGASH